MGIVIFGALAVYAIVLVLVAWLAYRWAAKRGLPRAKRWVAAAGGFLLVYLPVFWDHIPTLITHEYYCEKEAGFWIYKTPKQWEKENPGVMEELVYNKAMPHVQTVHGVETALNQRFIHVYKHEGPFLFNRWRIATEIRDSKNGEVIAREISFSTSQERRQAGWSGWKFWLDSRRCNIENHRDQGSFDKITARFEGVKR